MKKFFRLHQKDIQILKKFKMVSKNCPACNSSKNKKIFLKLNFKFVICKKCQTVYVNPSPTEKALEKYYTSSKSMKFWDTIFRETESIRKKKIFQPRVKLISQILKNYNLRNCKTMVEVGAGYGWFCDLAKQKNLAKSIIAIEPSPDLAESCRKIKGIKVIESTIEKNTEKLDSDLIVSFELVHLLYNPKSFFYV